MKQFLYLLCQWTWGLPQNLVGGALYLWYRLHGCPHFRYQGAFGVVWTRKAGSMSMGSFLFMHPSWDPENRDLLAHEYGHTFQSALLGPLYLPAVGIPSFLWANLPRNVKKRSLQHIPYESHYPENWAEKLGHKHFPKVQPNIFSPHPEEKP